MSNRNNISSGSDWESKIGYSRAVRIGQQVSVSGTTASGPDGPVGGDSLAEQTREAVSRIVAALAEAGAKPEDVSTATRSAIQMLPTSAAVAADAKAAISIFPSSPISMMPERSEYSPARHEPRGAMARPASSSVLSR